VSLDLTVTDLFCGAGGSSIGAEAMGARLRMAANHWSLAIETHAANFPNADHDCADVSQVDPRRYPSTDILIASPECTHHSIARTKKHQADLFNPAGDPAAERSRATMWDVPRFAEQHRYQLVIVENVVEVCKWAPFDAWLHAMTSLGYEHKLVSMNSMTAPPTPQSRDRVYVVFWRAGNRTPDLDLRARAWCTPCDTTVDAVQVFKRPDRRVGKYRQQYLYRCPTCASVAIPFAYPAASAIDWSLECPRVGDRSRPLAPATLRRIKLGLERFGAAIIQKSGHTFEREGYARAWSTTGPMPTQTTEVHHGIAIPFIAELRGGGSKNKSRPVSDPLATMTASGTHHGLVCPPSFIVKNFGDGRDPSMAHPITNPLGAVTTKDHHSLVALPFTVDYHGNGRAHAVDEPLGTCTTRDRHAVVEPRAIEVEDCGFRMLEPHEIGRAMAFPDTYEVRGNKRERVKQFGNAVTPPVMTRLLQRAVESLS
jgi:DNA (cytosine-5)-methyltransferase 1